MSVSITIRFEDGSLETVRTEAFVLCSFEKDPEADPKDEGLIPKTYEFPPGQTWPVVESIDILSERLEQEDGAIFKVIGQAVKKVVAQGRQMISAAVTEMKKNQVVN
tara:strand:- start:129 stop:449 length:321 start_codon:yes stop_codon:yes gene_type:complete